MGIKFAADRTTSAATVPEPEPHGAGTAVIRVRVAVTADKESALPCHVLPGTMKISHQFKPRAPRTPPPPMRLAISMAQPARGPTPWCAFPPQASASFTPAHATSARATLRKPYDVTDRASPPSTRPARRWPRVPARGSDGSRSASAG